MIPHPTQSADKQGIMPECRRGVHHDIQQLIVPGRAETELRADGLVLAPAVPGPALLEVEEAPLALGEAGDG